MMTKTDRALISAHVARIGADAFRITRDGDLHIKGTMPNSIEYGWYFAGEAALLVADLKEGNR